jgi:osomolarity two-component system sensor histidine kinase TcsA
MELALDAFWDLSPLPTLVVSSSYRIKRVSQGAVTTWERSRAELVDRNLFDALYSGSALERFDRIPLASSIDVAVSNRTHGVCTSAYVTQNSAWSARIVPIFRDEVLDFVVLEFAVSEGRLREGQIADRSVDEMFRLLVHNVKDYAIFLLDTRGYVATWNIGAELLKGYKREDIIGQHFSNFYGKDDLQAGKPEAELMTCLRQGRVEDEGWRYRKDGSKFWANVVITAIYRDGVHVGFGKVTRDLTERRENELRLISAYEESSKLKNDFLANVSHEIRTPMHGLLSACGLLLETRLSEDQRETANIISESGQVLLGVINSILDYSKLTSGAFSITSEAFSVEKVVTSVIRTAQTTAMPGVQIKLHLAPDLPSLAQGDQLRFRQIMQNITDNAAKFTEEGYITVSCAVREENDTGYMLLTEVVDSGIGVTTDDVHDLFQPFVQSEESINKRFQGTGLGLSIAKSLAVLMGGDMGYRPNPNCRGSIFWFTVRLNKTSAVAAEKPENTYHSTYFSRNHTGVGTENSVSLLKRLKELGSTKRILAVEDNIINQKVLVGMLHSFDLKDLAVAPDGLQAVSMLNSSPKKFDLVLMDVSMPVMDGFEATAKIRSGGNAIPIIAMTANALRGYREKCLQSGMDDYIPKPVSKKILMQKLLFWLDREDQPSAQPFGTIDGPETPPITPSETCTSETCKAG